VSRLKVSAAVVIERKALFSRNVSESCHGKMIVLCERPTALEVAEVKKAESGETESVLQTLRMRRIGAKTTSERKNQNGIRHAKARLSTGCVRIRKKAIATHT
jgi:hypothetical protein